MQDYAVEFKSYLTTEKKASANTIESYLRDLAKFIHFCKSVGIKSVANATKADIEKYSDYILSGGQSSSTVARALATLRCYYSFLQKNNYISVTPMVGVQNKPTAKKLPEILTNKEIISLINQPDINEPKGCRDKAMIELLYATGIKTSEIISLNVDDVNLQIGILHIQTKSGERVIPIYPEAVKVLSLYINNIRSSIVIENTDKLFTNMNGQPMTRQGFWKIIKQYAVAANINKDITPHTLRHSFAAHLLENGAQLTDIKEMLGHADISSTQIYAQLLKSKYTSAYKHFHPLAR